MRIVVCVKEVLDPAAVNNYALSGGLAMSADGRHPEVAAIPRLINGYDEQALEAALRLRDAGLDCRIVVVTIATEAASMLKQCAALGADEIVAIDPGSRELDAPGIATVLAACLTGRSQPGAELLVNLPGGELSITVAPDLATVWMRGPATFVFDAVIDPAAVTRSARPS